MTHPVNADDILDAALRVATGRHWETVRLADIAAEMGTNLRNLHAVIADKESIVELLWDRADRNLLENADTSLQALPVPRRLENLVFAWLQPLSPHRRTVREMLLVRLEPGHLHIQLPTLLRISKTVQWLREAAGLRATFMWRALEESALSALFVATVATWLRSDSDEPARLVLQKGLAVAHALRQQAGPDNTNDKD